MFIVFLAVSSERQDIPTYLPTYLPTYHNSRIKNLLTYSRLTRRYISYAVKPASLKDLKINEFRTQLSASCIFSEEFRNVVL